MANVCLRQYKETDAQFAKREFNYCMRQTGRCHDLQFERRRMGWLGAAIFYQFEAARWYDRAMVCRARYDEAIAAIIPGTAVRWDDLFYIQLIGRGQRVIGPSRILYVDITMEATPENTVRARYHDKNEAWADVFAMVPTFRETERSAKIVIEPKMNTLTLAQQALKLANSSPYGKWKMTPDPHPRSSHYQTPAQKFDNPRDVPLSSFAALRDLIDGIGSNRTPILCIFPKCTNGDASLTAMNKCNRCKIKR